MKMLLVLHLLLCLSSILCWIALASSTNNPYTILGVARDASQDEIRKSYKKLCLKYHPDKNIQRSERERKVCEATFKLVQEAYSKIGDEDSRQQYEARAQFEERGSSWGSFSPPRAGSPSSNDFAEEILRSMFRQRPRTGVYFNGVDISQFGPRDGGLAREGGVGSKTIYLQKVRVPLQDMYHGRSGMAVRLRDGAIERYRAVFRGGSGIMLIYQASAASLVLLGRVRLPFALLFGALFFHSRLPRPQNTHYEVDIKRGWKGGTKLSYHEVEPGLDVVFVLEEVPHKKFRRVGNDLHTFVTIDRDQAKEGCSVTVALLGKDEEPIEVTVGPNPKPGDVIRIKGKGWPSRKAPRGDLIVALRVVRRRQKSK